MRPRTAELRARCDEKHVKALQAIARIEGVHPGEALRLIVREKAREYGVWPHNGRRQAQEGE